MKCRFSMAGISLTLMALFASAAFSNANAQGPGDGPPGGGPPRGGPGQGRPGFGGPGRPGFGGPRTISVVDVPVTLLASELKLSTAQTAKIAQIQKDARQQRRDSMPRFGGPGSDPANRPDPATMMAKMRSMDKATTSSIEAVLTAGQKKALPALIKQMDTMRKAGIPAEVYSDLKLTADQKQQMTAIAAAAPADQPGTGREGMRQTREKLMAVLTSDQHATLDAYMKAHPRRGFGGRRGPGGPGGPDGFGRPGGSGGGRGGPGDGPDGAGGPPPPDGAGGPPPPDDNGPPPPDDNGPPPPDDNGPPPPEPGDMPGASR